MIDINLACNSTEKKKKSTEWEKTQKVKVFEAKEKTIWFPRGPCLEKKEHHEGEWENLEAHLPREVYGVFDTFWTAIPIKGMW